MRETAEGHEDTSGFCLRCKYNQHEGHVALVCGWVLVGLQDGAHARAR